MLKSDSAKRATPSKQKNNEIQKHRLDSAESMCSTPSRWWGRCARPFLRRTASKRYDSPSALA